MPARANNDSCCATVLFAEPSAPNTAFEFAGARELANEEDVFGTTQHKKLLSMKRWAVL